MKETSEIAGSSSEQPSSQSERAIRSLNERLAMEFGVVAPDTIDSDGRYLETE